MTIQTKKSLLGLMAGVLATGIVFSVGSERASVYEGAAEVVEKVVSIDIVDFGSPTLTTATTTYNFISCDFPATLSTGRESSDPIGGFRVNNTGTRYLDINFGTKTLVGYSGTFYLSTASRTLVFNGTTVGTFTRVASTGTETIIIQNKVSLTTSLNGTVRITSNGSFGIVEIILYYTA
jgi:hypothetical protein